MTSFAERYTTTEKISKDHTGVEATKTVITAEAFANGEMQQAFVDKLEQMRLSMMV